MLEIILSVTSFLNELELACVHTNVITISTSCYKYCYLTLIILFKPSDCLM